MPRSSSENPSGAPHDTESDQAGATVAATLGGGAGLWMMIVGGVMVVALLVAHLMGVDVDIPRGEGLVTGLVFAALLVPVVLGFIMWSGARKARRVLLHGQRGTGHITAVGGTGTRVNGVDQYRLTLSVSLEGQPAYTATTKLLLCDEVIDDYQPGASVKVRVDPKDPKRVLVETA